MAHLFPLLKLRDRAPAAFDTPAQSVDGAGPQVDHDDELPKPEAGPVRE